MSNFVPELIRLLRENPRTYVCLCYEPSDNTIEVETVNSEDMKAGIVTDDIDCDRLDRSRHPGDVLIQVIEDLLSPEPEDPDAIGGPGYGGAFYPDE